MPAMCFGLSDPCQTFKFFRRGHSKQRAGALRNFRSSQIGAHMTTPSLIQPRMTTSWMAAAALDKR